MITTREMWIVPGVKAEGSGDNRLHPFVSPDFNEWTDASDGAGCYSPTQGILRDPTLIYRRSDGKYRCAYTAMLPGNRAAFGLIASETLKTWTHIADVPVHVTGLTEGETRCTWGPMLWQDPETEEVFGSVNAFDSTTDTGLSPVASCYVAKATNAELTEWSGTGIGVAPWAALNVTGLPTGYYAKDFEIIEKRGGTYYGLVIASNGVGLGSYFTASATNPLGLWTLLNPAQNIEPPYPMESGWIWRDGRGDYWQIASLGNGSFYLGKNGYHMRKLGGDLADVNLEGAWLPFAMDHRGTQGNNAAKGNVPIEWLRAVGAPAAPQGTPLVAPSYATGQLSLPPDGGWNTGGVTFRGNSVSDWSFLGAAVTTNELLLRLPSGDQPLLIFDGSANLIAKLTQGGDLFLAGTVQPL